MSATVSHVMAVLELLRGNATATAPSAAALLATLHAIVPPARMATAWRAEWEKLDGTIQTAITVQGDGGLGVERVPVSAQGRVLIRCWATVPHVANQLAQLVSALLLPVAPGESGWVAATTRVDGVSGVSAPLEYLDPTLAARHLAMQLTASVRYRRLAVAA